MRKVFLLVGAALFFAGCFVIWRAMNPPLTDSEQIAANIEAIRRAAESKKANRVVSYLAPEFSMGGMNKDELRSQLIGGNLRFKDIVVNISGLKVDVTDETAVATGTFSVALREGRRPEAYVGRFRTSWEKRDGEWLVVAANGLNDVGNG